MHLSPGYVRKLESISAVFLLYLSREAVEHNHVGPKLRLPALESQSYRLLVLGPWKVTQLLWALFLRL